MDFKKSLLDHLSSTNGSTMKETFDLMIQHAKEQDPEFVKLYKWPTNASESTERQLANSNLTRTDEEDLTDQTPESSSTSAQKETLFSVPLDQKLVDIWDVFLNHVVQSLSASSNEKHDYIYGNDDDDDNDADDDDVIE
ncbi:hypothetical protein HPULCUR_008811 [Helicostylum pulchrum]|uniref:Uncharacterized protein n=1 Tax=Helicostylum pulchrum TaxID=562976 RepID=A0ABP9YAK5_9FUNG